MSILVFCLYFTALTHADALRPRASSIYQMVTGDDTEDDRKRWDSFFSTQTYVYGKEAAPFIRENIAQLPVGLALDIAMGEGRNAVYLAKKGFLVDGVDFSEVAIRKANRLARENRVTIRAINSDLSAYVIKPAHYDVIMNIDFLQRSLIPGIKRGLRKGGVVVFEGRTVDQIPIAEAAGVPIRREFLLGKGELKELFKEFEVLKYEETNDGKDARASLIARKRTD